MKTGKISFRKIINVVWCTLAYHFQWKKSGLAPYILSLELWNECNAGCLFCRDKKGRIYDIDPSRPEGGGIPKGEMPSDWACDIIRQVKDDVLTAVLYTNGEPLLYKDLPLVVKSATDNKVSTVIATNGLLFTEENARALLEAGADLIKIQLSGFTQDIYSIQIRYGHVEKLKENIRMLAGMNKEGGYGTIILIDYIYYEYNRHQYPLIKNFCRELGLKMNIRPGNPKHGLEDREPALAHDPLPLKMSCDWLWKGMQINWNGQILQCCEAVVWGSAKPYDTYQTRKTDVKKVWNGPQAMNMRERIHKKGRGDIPICSQCTRQGVVFKW